jgi:hypothetical protein
MTLLAPPSHSQAAHGLELPMTLLAPPSRSQAAHGLELPMALLAGSSLTQPAARAAHGPAGWLLPCDTLVFELVFEFAV